MVFKLKDVTDVGLCTLQFTGHYTVILQVILTSLMLFYCKFLVVYACQKIIKIQFVFTKLLQK